MAGPDRVERPLLEVASLKKHFPIGGGMLRRKRAMLQAVDGVSFTLGAGETLGIVGESGSGKSTVLRLIASLIEPTAGSIRFEGRELIGLGKRELYEVRRHIQMIFQDPYGSLNPRMTIGDIVSEPWIVHPGIVAPQDRKAAARELLEKVGLRASLMDRYPSEFSGGQQQRVGIARALALKPRIILCDEPLSSLDVSIQAQVILLLEQLRRDFGLSYVFVSHDFSVVRILADRIGIMYLGRLVEIGRTREVYERPEHPYTRALMSAVPRIDLERTSRSERIRLPGEIPSPTDPPSGCRFRTRCWKADARCAAEEPALVERLGTGRLTACHYPENASQGPPPSPAPPRPQPSPSGLA